MKSATIKLALVAVLASAGLAQAHVYTELGLAQANINQSVEGLQVKSSPLAVRAIVGYDVHKNLAVEGLAEFGAGSDPVWVNGHPLPVVTSSLDSAFGVFVKAKTELPHNFEAFARLGSVRSKSTLAAGPERLSEKVTSIAYGAGLSYRVNKNWSASVDYTSYADKHSVTTDGITLGAVYRF